MITSNVLARTFFIQSSKGTGTGFTLDFEKGQFLVTAKHVLDHGASTRQIEVYHESEWKTLSVEPVPAADEKVEAIALKLPYQISPNLILETSLELFVSQELFFLGFPFGLFTDASLHNNGFPMPFVKRATCAAFGGDSESRVQVIFLDGIGNRGFSGGPIISLKNGWKRPSVVGVVDSAFLDERPVLLHGKELKLISQENSGIIIGYGMGDVLDAINALP